MQTHFSQPLTGISVCASLLIRESLKGFNSQAIDKILALTLSTFEHRSEETTYLWTESTTTLPRIFRASECWDAENLNSISKLVLSTLLQIEETKGKAHRGFNVYRRSEQSFTVDPRLAIAQLVEPTEDSPVVIFGLSFLQQGIFHIPVSLSEFVEGLEEDSQQLLLAPKYAFTDLHLDTSDGISSPMGTCRKLWVVFPPTTNNLALMKQADGQRAKLDRIGKNLEGGLVFVTNSDEAIYLPIGCIHAVITLEGGFLIGIDFTTPLSSRPYSAMINAGLDDSAATKKFQEEVFQRFLSSVDYGLSFKHQALAISSWIGTSDRVQKYAKDCPSWKKDAVKVWDEFYGKKEGKEMTCVCGNQGKTNFENHFKRVHMWQVERSRKRGLEVELENVDSEQQPTRKSKRLRSG